MTFVRERVVQAAITRLLTSLNPAGAFIQAIIATYNTIMFFVERMRQIGQVVAAYIDSIAAIAAGNIGTAANRVETTMAGLLTLVISFLARIAGLGRVSDAVVNIVNRVRAPIDRALDRVIEWIVNMARRIGRFIAQAGLPSDPNERLRLGMQAAVSAVKRLAAGRVTQAMIAPVLAAIKLRYGFKELRPLVEDGVWQVEGEINPKTKLTTEVKENLLADAQRRFRAATFRSGELKAFLMAEGKIEERTARRLMTSWEQDEGMLFVSRSRPGDAAPIMSFNASLVPEGARPTVRRDVDARPDNELIDIYQKIVKAAFGNDTDFSSITDPSEYRERMRERIGRAGKYANNLVLLNSEILVSGIVPASQNRIKGDIFEIWCAHNLGMAQPGPIFLIENKRKIQELQREKIIADLTIGTSLVDAKVRLPKTGPDGEAKRQMDGYAYVLGQRLKSIQSQGEVTYKGPFTEVIYVFNDKSLIPLWKTELERRIPSVRTQ
jgi:hypothetical protein